MSRSLVDILLSMERSLRWAKDAINETEQWGFCENAAMMRAEYEMAEACLKRGVLP